MRRRALAARPHGGGSRRLRGPRALRGARRGGLECAPPAPTDGFLSRREGPPDPGRGVRPSASSRPSLRECRKAPAKRRLCSTMWSSANTCGARRPLSSDAPSNGRRAAREACVLALWAGARRAADSALHTGGARLLALGAQLVPRLDQEVRAAAQARLQAHGLLRDRGQVHPRVHVHEHDGLPVDDVVASAARVPTADLNAEEAPRLVVGRVLQPCGAWQALARDDQKTLLRRGALVPRRVTAQEALTTIPVALNGGTG